MVEKIPRETLQEKVYESIKNSIVKNELMPGDVLSIDTLAEDFGVSPTPVREALAQLSTQGLVNNARNKKARVAPITEDDIHEIYEVRKLLEPYATGLAAEQIADDPKLKAELKELKDETLELQRVVENGPLGSDHYERYLEVDLELEEIIEMALGDTLLNKLMRQVGNHSLRIRSFTEVSYNKEVTAAILANNEEHLEILEKMLELDLEGMREAVKNHLENAEERTLKALKDNS